MKNRFNNILGYIYKLESKIAFYPTLLSLAGIGFAFIMYYLESRGISGYLVKNAPLLVVNDTETARTLLTTFIAGLISIMVFSFSMVMILLNQASSNFSPRVLPGLISNSRHQFILGIYNASLLYCIFTLVAIEPNGNQYQLPGFSVLLSIGSMTLCLGAFIYFIHSISQEIQVNNIMDRIYTTAKTRLQYLIDEEKYTDVNFPNSKEWEVVESIKSGYLSHISLASIKEIASDSEIKFSIIQPKGKFIQKGMPILSFSKALDEDSLEAVMSAFHFSKSELIEDNYILAFNQITEIAIKAMSPGINDPGTALNAIDYLTELFALRLRKRDTSYVFNDEDEALISVNTINFDVLFYNIMAYFRTYCKHDVVVVIKLLNMLIYLFNCEDISASDYKSTIKKELELLYKDTKAALKNKTDLEHIESIYNSAMAT
ncbi:MAG: DUF2254 domain-containing protein [Winogradskyella sp.]|uniref:DUF2254 domain-containing protein n=1 Tax=Winogradskyella sp. TaxID=1883156 RepID=UPI00181CBF55|nr:DUF2254 domain-containing protein [Winogradskyella sp.]